MMIREQVIKARLNNRSATLQQIGAEYHITRERVRQILKEAGLQTAASFPPNPCPQCGKDMGNTHQHLFCSPECWQNSTRTLIPCTQCGELREYRIKYITWEIDHNGHSPNLFFCSKRCQGKWVAGKYGFGVFPEHQRLGVRQKWDYEKIEELILAGYSILEVAEKLGMSHGSTPTIYKIIHDRNLPYTCGQIKRSSYYAEVLKLRGEGMTCRRIAEKLNLPLGTVTSIIRRQRIKYS